MPTIVHFIDVGQGNMTLLQLGDETIMLYDCNVTQDNEQRVLAYMAQVLPRRTIDIFVNSHRDADHMRGIRRVHRIIPISKIWDSSVTGGTTDSPEYREYMELRRELPCMTVERRKYWDFGRTRVRVMNAKNEDLPDDPNAQSIVMKIQHHQLQTGNLVSSVMLTGDSNAQTWRRSTATVYSDSDLRSSILLASHHGSITFFDDPADERNYYVEHMKKISPEMTVISVGANVHGHPHPKALELYEKYTSGSAQGNKIFRTDQQGTIKLLLKDEGGWSMTSRQ